MRRLSRHSNSNHSSEQTWMIIFSDLLTLMLTMFVLRLSMTSFPQSALASIEPVEEVQQQVTETKISPLTTAVLENIKANFSELSIEETADSFVINSELKLKKQEVGSSLIIKNSAFQQFDDEINFRASVAITAFAKAVSDKSSQVYVLAYSNEDDLDSSPEIDIWSLSAKRAQAVARQIIDTGVDKQTVSLMGYVKNLALRSNPNREVEHHNGEVIIMAVPKTPKKPGVIIDYSKG